MYTTSALVILLLTAQNDIVIISIIVIITLMIYRGMEFLISPNPIIVYGISLCTYVEFTDNK